MNTAAERTNSPSLCNRPRISASVMCAELGRLRDEIAALEMAGVNQLHFDIMDGQFVPQITFGPLLIQAVRSSTTLEIEAHLMVLEPDRQIEAVASAGVDRITVHVESCTHLLRTLQQIKRQGPQVGVAISPATPLEDLQYVLGELSEVLILSVDPGFSGQTMTPAVLPKISQLRDMVSASGLDIEIGVDGNVNEQTAALFLRAGASLLVGGSSGLFRKDMELIEAVARLRAAGEFAAS